jgi:N4-gp56 family major capsid protein
VSYVEVLHSNGLTVTQWENSIFKEYLGFTRWKLFASTGSDSILQVKENLTKESGDSITIGLRGRLVGGRVDGSAKGAGNEGTLSFYNQNITVDQYRRLVKMENVAMSNQRVSFDVLVQAKQALEDEVAFDFDDDVTDALVATSTGHVQGRYLYGALESNYSATHATGLGNVDATADMLTTKIISRAKRKALQPLNASAKIRPIRVVTGKEQEEWFVFMGHTYAVRDLMDSDASWQNKLLNLTPQSAMSNSPFFSGSAFKGNHDGVLIYEYDRLPVEAGLGAGSIDVAHNLFLGAQAGAICWAQRSKFAEDDYDVHHDRVYEISEIRGISKLVFNRATPEDNGIVHVFTAAVADS